MTMVQRDEVIKRVHRQHSSLVVVVPVAVRSLLTIHKGDYIFFSWTRGRKRVTFGKVDLGGGHSNGRAKHTVRKNRGG